MFNKLGRQNTINKVYTTLRGFSVTACCFLLVNSEVSFAQDSTSALEEVIVTAQKREQNLQDVPIAITAFTGEALDDRGIVDLEGLAQRTPSFTYSAKDAGALQLNVRGISSSDDGAAADNSVIVYVDDVPIGRAAGQDLDLFDLERVEVLRGPQGTLFGRNAIGGAIHLITTKPDEEVKAKFEAKLGNLNRQDFRGLLSGPISETLFGKVSFSSRNRDGILRSNITDAPNFSELFPGLPSSTAGEIDALDIDTSSIRGALRYLPNEALELNLSAAYTTLDQSGPQRVFIGDEQEFGVRGDLLVPGQRDDFNREFFDDRGFSRIDTYSTTLRTDYTFNNDYTLTSITAIRDIDAEVNDVISSLSQVQALLTVPSSVVDASLIGITLNPYSEDVTTFTQEIRVTSPGDQRFQWVAGGFYLDEDVNRNEQIILDIQTRGDATDEIISVNDVVSLFGGPGESGDDQDVDVESIAVFGQFDYQLTDSLTVTGGLRWTEDTKDISRIGTADGVVVPEPFFVVNSATFSEVTPKLVLSYQPNDGTLLYGSYSRGFKSGGFQGRGTSAASVTPAFNPEIADTIEFGLKSTFLGGRVQFNPTVYFTEFSDLQQVFLLRPEGSPAGTTASLVTANAADAEIFGVELEYSAQVTDGLSFSGGFSYIDAEFIEFFTPGGFETEDGGPLPNNLAGNRLTNTPEFAATQIVTYGWDAPKLNGSFVARGEYIYQDQTFGSLLNEEDVSIPSYSLGNLSLTYINGEKGKGGEFSLWVQNVTDEDYLQNSFSQDGGGRALPGAPRTYGVTFRWSY